MKREILLASKKRNFPLHIYLKIEILLASKKINFQINIYLKIEILLGSKKRNFPLGIYLKVEILLASKERNFPLHLDLKIEILLASKRTHFSFWFHQISPNYLVTELLITLQRMKFVSLTPNQIHKWKFTKLTDSYQADIRKRGENDNSQNSDPSSRSRKSKRKEDKRGNQSQQDDQSLYQKFGIYTEIDPDETSYVNIQFTTLILKEYWKKIDAICLRIGHMYFGYFRTSIVPFNIINTVKLQCGKFVTISGTLKFPVKHISNGEIRFPYKYFIYSKDNNASYEHLHHSYNNFNRYFIWNTSNNPVQPLINGSYQQFDMMILPEIRKKEGPTFWNIVNTAISFVGASGGYDKDIPFHKIGDRRLVSLQTLLPSYLGLGHSQPCSTMEDFITHFNKQILTLVNFSIQCVGEGIHGVRHWDFSEQVKHDNLIQLVEAWIMNTFSPEKKSQLEKKHVVYIFYIGCYLIDYYRLNNNELNLKMVNMIKESIEPILKNQYFLFDNTICIHQQFGIELHSSIFTLIFNKAIFLTNQHDFFLTLIPIYHGINNMQEHSNTLHEELQYTENNYWGFPNEVTIYWQNVASLGSIQKVLSLTKYDQIYSIYCCYIRA